RKTGAAAPVSFHASQGPHNRRSRSGAPARHSAREGRRVDPSHVFHHAYHLATVAELVVVPHVEHHAIVVGNGGFGIDHTGVTRADEVGGYHFLRADEVDLLLQV